MPDPNRIPPPRRPDLVLGPPTGDGGRVVKDPRTGEFFNLGPEEAFLLAQLDGRRTAAQICAAYRDRFGDPLDDDELAGFLEVAHHSRFLQSADQPPAPVPEETAAAPAAGPPVKASRWSFQSLLYWRFNFFDPNGLFDRIEPRIRFLWTRTFAVVSLAGILAAFALLVSNRDELIGYLPSALRWETLVLGWLTLVLATFLHEFAHGLTCKHYGGAVHEVGFLFLFGMPCFYCNVSDAWLFPRKSRRLLVTLAGGYCDLCVWAVAVFVWRLTPPDSVPHYVAYVLLTVCGSRVFFNFNPFLKLDGYYLLSDWAEVPNLRQRGLDRLMAWARCLLWGGRRPEPEPRPLFVLAYGAACWLITVVYLSLLMAALFHVFGTAAGLVGRGAALGLAVYLSHYLFTGFFKGEFLIMLRSRLLRVLIWLVVLGGVAAVMVFVEIEDRRTGPFVVRPAARAELRARVSGFVRQVHYDEGDEVSQGAAVAQLEIPDLESKIAGKATERREAKARLALLEAGPRAEEMKEARAKLARARHWRDQAAQDLKRNRSALEADLVRFDKQLHVSKAELDYARYAYERDQKLYAQDVLPRDQFRDKKKNLEVRESMLAQTKAEKSAREAKGVLEAEAELARREKEIADFAGTLALLEAGSRAEEIEVERAKLARLTEEHAYLESQRGHLAVLSPVAGTVITPRLKEKLGQHVKEGDPICVVDSVKELEIEMSLDEQDLERVRVGAVVEVKARAFPFHTFTGEVSRIAPAARREQQPAEPGKAAAAPRPDAPGTVTVYVALHDADGLRPGLTGNARVHCGKRRIAAIVTERALRLVRVDYWW